MPDLNDKSWKQPYEDIEQDDTICFIIPPEDVSIVIQASRDPADHSLFRQRTLIRGSEEDLCMCIIAAAGESKDFKRLFMKAATYLAITDLENRRGI